MTTEPTSREEIREVLGQYCRGIDRLDRALVAGCFHPEATDDHGTGPLPVADFLEWCFTLLESYDSTFHFLGQTTFQFSTDDHVRTETYGVASHRAVEGAPHHNLTTGFRYLDVLTRPNDRWRILERRAVTDWSRVDPAAAWWPVPDTLLQGRRGPDDPSYHH